MKISYAIGLKSWFQSSFSSRVLFLSTEAQTSSWSSSRDTLYRRLWLVGDPRVSIVPVLDKWIEDGRIFKRENYQVIIKQLRYLRRYKHALELSQWMSHKSYFVLTPGDIAVRLDLISKVHGLEQAEVYFNNIPKHLRVFQIYGALLNCYAYNKSVEKAEALMEKMKQLRFTRTTLDYNILLKLYSQLGQYEKLDSLFQEMKEKGTRCDKFTFSIRLSAYAALSDIGGMETILDTMEADSRVEIDWNVYAVAANGYIKAGLIDKALEMLRKSEGLVTGKRRVAFDFFLTLYAGTGKKDELYRIWNLYKTSERAYNSTYMCMISSLLKLDDIEGAERILKEWKSGGSSTYDCRLPNLLIAAYCKKGLLEKAEALINEAVERGKKPHAGMWDLLVTGYLENNQIAKAVETMKKAILASQPGWEPNRDTLVACLEHLKGQRDVEGAKELVRLLGAHGPLSMDVCDRLLNCFEY